MKAVFVCLSMVLAAPLPALAKECQANVLTQLQESPKFKGSGAIFSVEREEFLVEANQQVTLGKGDLRLHPLKPVKVIAVTESYLAGAIRRQALFTHFLIADPVTCDLLADHTTPQ